MRIICAVFAFCYIVINNEALITPRTTINTSIYHYKPEYDIYRYGSKDRKIYKKKYYHLVQDHHIIPKEFKDHSLIKSINYVINSSNNLIIMPTPNGIIKLCLTNDLQTHYKGHTKYNAFIKKNLNIIDKYYFPDDKKYYFWLFHKYLKKKCKYVDNDIPWI